MATDLATMLKTISRWEKDLGGDHRMRHVFSGLREARYAASKLSENDSYDSPGRQQARDTAGKANIPEPEDARNPTVPESTGESGGDGGGDS